MYRRPPPPKKKCLMHWTSSLKHSAEYSPSEDSKFPLSVECTVPSPFVDNPCTPIVPSSLLTKIPSAPTDRPQQPWSNRTQSQCDATMLVLLRVYVLFSKFINYHTGAQKSPAGCSRRLFHHQFWRLGPNLGQISEKKHKNDNSLEYFFSPLWHVPRWPRRWSFL